MGNIKKKKHRKPFKNHFEKFYEFDTSYKSWRIYEKYNNLSISSKKNHILDTKGYRLTKNIFLVETIVTISSLIKIS